MGEGGLGKRMGQAGKGRGGGEEGEGWWGISVATLLVEGRIDEYFYVLLQRHGFAVDSIVCIAVQYA